MKINKNEFNVVVDVDSTLILHDVGRSDTANIERVTLDYYGSPKSVVPHLAHVELVKSYKQRGFHVTVWSNNGWRWALQAVEKLGLSDYVDQVQTKPCKHVDDETAIENIVGARVYIPNPEHQ